MKNKLLTIINTYGIEHQLDKLQEEIDELKEAIKECNSIDDYADKLIKREHIIEEYADVLNVLEQFRYYYDFDSADYLSIRKNKVDRQLKRIENGVEKD